MKSKFLTQPYLLSLHPDSEMHIVWIQRERSRGQVEFGGDETLGKWIEAEEYPVTGLYLPGDKGYSPVPGENVPAEIWQYIARIDGLTPGQRVYYRCHAEEEATCIYDFRAAPEKGTPFTAAQLSDLQGMGNCHVTVGQIGRMHPDLMLYSGDMTMYAWRADNWFDMEDSRQSEEERRRAFFPCIQQTEQGARLAQYCPLYVCPGNHETDDFRLDIDREYSARDENWTWSVFTQLFRPLYDVQDVTLTGKRWYSADYGDMHIVSLSIMRCACWGAYEWPGWRLADDISENSPQMQWLVQDLKNTRQPFIWVIQHWHMLNKGGDVQFNLCNPVFDEQGRISYPVDGCSALMDVFERYGVNGVSYGHSHVYERYYERHVHYIEAAYLGVCYREENAALHPGGYLPLVEDNSRCSFLMIRREKEGLTGYGYYVGQEDAPFDKYRIADAFGRS